MTTSVTVSRLPTDINGEWWYNAISWNQDNVCTANGVQVAAWWGPDKVVNIGRRLLPNGAWSSRTLPNGGGYSFSTAAADLHNTLAVAFDSDGFIHLAGNMHNDSMRYARSGAPYDHNAMFMAGPMVGTEENSVTYPQFVYMPDGELLLFYRNGSSGDGNVYLNAYDTATRTWSRRCTLLDGLTSSESPYLHRVAVDHDGRLHAFVMWRATTSGATNSDFSYLTSDDNGVTWTKANHSTTYTLPVTHAAIEVIVPGTVYLNQCGADGDTDGNPHAAVQYITGGIPQVHHVWHDGSVWHNQSVSGFGSGEASGRPSVFCPDDGSTVIFYNAYRAGVWVLQGQDVTAGDVPDPFPLSFLWVQGYEVTYDVRALRERGELYILSPIAIYGGSTAIGFMHVDNWNRQWCGVLGFDTDEMDDFVLQNVPTPAIVTVTSEVGSAASLPISGPDLLYRVTATGSGTITVREARTGQTDVVRTAFTATSTQQQTPWIPLRLTGDGTVTLEGAPSTALLEVGSVSTITGTPIPPAPFGVNRFVKFTLASQTFVVDLAPPVGADINVPPPTGSDDTAMILAAIDSAGSGHTVTFGPDLTYIVDGTLELEGLRDVTIDVNGSTIHATTPGIRERSHWRLTDCTNVTLNDPVVIGANPHAGLSDEAYDPDFEAQHAFEIVGCHDIVINRPVASDIYGDFVYVTSLSGVWTEGVVVNTPTFARNGRQGFTVIAGRDVECYGGTWEAIRRSFIDLEPNVSSQGTDGFTMRDCTLTGLRLSFLASQGADGHINDVTIENVDLVGAPMTVTVLAPTVRRTNFTITGCTSDTQHGTGTGTGVTMRFTRVDGLTVTGNVQPMQSGRGMALVGLTDCTDVDVSGNTVVNGIQSRNL